MKLVGRVGKEGQRLKKMCKGALATIYILAEGAKWFVIMLIKSVMQCTNEMGWNAAGERTKNCPLKT